MLQGRAIVVNVADLEGDELQPIALAQPLFSELRQPQELRGGVGFIEVELGETFQRKLRGSGMDVPDVGPEVQTRFGNGRGKPTRGDVGHQANVVDRRGCSTPGHNDVHHRLTPLYAICVGTRQIQYYGWKVGNLGGITGAAYVNDNQAVNPMTQLTKQSFTRRCSIGHGKVAFRSERESFSTKHTHLPLLMRANPSKATT